MNNTARLLAAALCLAAPTTSYAQEMAAMPASPAPATMASTALTLPQGTPIVVVMNDELSSKANNLGDRFQVAVAYDVVDKGVVVIPKGTIGYGDVTFSTDRGGFGKGGILGIALRFLDLNGKHIELDGRYREEGKERNGATAATFAVAGIFAGFVKGNGSVIPKGRELKARTGEDITYSPAPPAATTTTDAMPVPIPSATSPAPPSGGQQPAAAESTKS